MMRLKNKRKGTGMSKVNIIMYHYVRSIAGSRYPGIKGLETGDFIKQLDFLKENGFSFIRMEELIASYQESYVLPEKAVLLTFDDAYRDHFTEVFPILHERGIQGSFFVPGEVVDRKVVLPVNKIHFILAVENDHHHLKEELLKMLDQHRGREFDIPENGDLLKEYEKPGKFDDPETVFVKKMLQFVLPERLRDMLLESLFDKIVDVPEKVLWDELYLKDYQIKAMKKSGMFFGAHGYHHYHLGEAGHDEMKEDIIKGLQVIDSCIDRDSWVMNYPYGSYNDDVLQVIRSLGAKLAITTKVGVNDTKKDDAFHICRLNTNDFPPKSDKYLNY